MDDDFDPNQLYAFVDVNTNVLQAWGYLEKNCRLLEPVCDRRVVVAWDFNLQVLHWRYDESVSPPVWVPYP